MATPAEEAFADGFAALSDVHASAWTFGASSFSGVASTLLPDDPRMEGSKERLIELRVRTSALPVAAPKRGDEITRGTRIHRVTMQHADPATGQTIYLLAA